MGVGEQSRWPGWLHGVLARASNRIPVERSIALLDSSAIALAFGLTPGLVLGASRYDGTLLDAVASFKTLDVAWQAWDRVALTSACIEIEILLGRTFQDLVACTSTSGIVLPDVIRISSRTFSLLIALALAFVSVVVSKRRCALEADGLILDDSIDDCCWCSGIFIFHCDFNRVCTAFQVAHSESVNLELGVASHGLSTVYSYWKCIISCDNQGGWT